MVKVFGKQFRSDTKDKVCIQKKSAHRQEVKFKCQPKKDKSTKPNPSTSSASSKTSNDAATVHQALVDKVTSDQKYLLKLKGFLKDDLKKLLNAYQIPYKTSLRKDQLNDILVKSLKEDICIKDENAIPAKLIIILNSPDKGKGKQKGKKSKEACTSSECKDNQDNFCAVCNREYVIDEEWIACDMCNRWLDRDCAGLREEDACCVIGNKKVTFVTSGPTPTE